MLWNNLIFATTLFFGWLLFDSVGSLLGSPLEGVYYPLASGWLKSVPADWTNKPKLAAPLYLLLFLQRGTEHLHPRVPLRFMPL